MSEMVVNVVQEMRDSANAAQPIDPLLVRAWCDRLDRAAIFDHYRAATAYYPPLNSGSVMTSHPPISCGIKVPDKPFED